MNSKQKTGIAMIAIVFGLAVSPSLFSNDVEARSPEEYTITVVQGDLTAPKGDKPFGGDVVGEFKIHVKKDYSLIYIDFDRQPSEDKVFEGWLVDVDSGQKTSFGTFDEYRNRNFVAAIDNQFDNDVIVITEEPFVDSDPEPATPVGGAVLENPFGQ